MFAFAVRRTKSSKCAFQIDEAGNLPRMASVSGAMLVQENPITQEYPPEQLDRGCVSRLTSKAGEDAREPAGRRYCHVLKIFGGFRISLTAFAVKL